MFKERNFSYKFKTQLTFSFIGMSLIVLIINSLFIYVGVEEILKDQSERETMKQFQQLEYNIKTYMNDVDKISRLLIISKDFQDLLDNEFSLDTEGIYLANSVYTVLSQMISNYEFIESIFYYGENGFIIGATSSRNDYIIDAEKKGTFFNSEIYKTVKVDNLRLHWFGGYSSGDFDMHDSNEKATYFITAARSVNYLGKQNATLVINLNEKLFTSIYNNNQGIEDSNMYIMEDGGKIISHTDQTQINNNSIVNNELNPGKPYGSTIIKQGTESNQVIYYQLDYTGWILVNEVPLNLLTKDIKKLRTIFGLMLFVGMVTAFCISIYWLYRITRPLNKLTAAMYEMEKGKLGHILTETSRNELGFLGRQFNKMSASILALINQIKAMENEKRILEIEALQAQINPHFLYNTLNTIKYMAVLIKANNIADSITALGNILNPIYRNNDILCSIEEEVGYLKNYIKIMNYRYGEGIKVIFTIPDELLNCKILRFILQPIIENSLSYGFAAQNDTGTISIIVTEENGDIIFIVEDNGEGMDDVRLQEVRESLTDIVKTKNHTGNGIGLVNVNQRIKLHFGNNYGIDISSWKGVGTKVALKLLKVQKS